MDLTQERRDDSVRSPRSVTHASSAVAAREERRRLADAAIAGFTRTFDHPPKSIASWVLDAYTVGYLADHYGIDAVGICRDQPGTDRMVIWGLPLVGGYFPSRQNLCSPALTAANQIPAPVFRLLGVDPVYAYDSADHLTFGVTKPGDGYCDTMEPTHTSGQSLTFVRHYLDMIARAPVLAFSHVQLGQENSMGWGVDGHVELGYPMQMVELARLRDEGVLTVETMGETGRRFKRDFALTPAQAVVALNDPFDRTDPAEHSIWYQSRFYRGNLHLRGDTPCLRDLHVYSDRYPEPYLVTPVTKDEIEQRLPPVLDGFHWSDAAVQRGKAGKHAGGYFALQHAGGTRSPIALTGPPAVVERYPTLYVTAPAQGGVVLHWTFGERELAVQADGVPTTMRLMLAFEWETAQAALTHVAADRLLYRFHDFDYTVAIAGGAATQTVDGLHIVAAPGNTIRLTLAQEA